MSVMLLKKSDPEQPDIGVLHVKYGKQKMHRPCCKTCQPEWRGEYYNGRRRAFDEAILHAMVKHGWVPKVLEEPQSALP